MDVRCEKCQTVYEFDDARVKEGGVTVKCTQCGHIFKVARKRPASARPRTLPGLAPLSDPGQMPAPPEQAEAQVEPPRAVGQETSNITAGDGRMWLLRSTPQGEVRRFRDLTTLQQWIVEKKAVRDDQISRTGERWKRIGGIAELAPFFRVVEQAEERARPASSNVVAPEAYSQTQPHPVVQVGPVTSHAPPSRQMAAAAGPGGAPDMRATRPFGLPLSNMPAAPASFAPPAMPAVDSSPALPSLDLDDGAARVPTSPSLPSLDEEYPVRTTPGLDEDDPELAIPKIRPSVSAVLAGATVLLLASVVGYLAVYKRAALRSIMASDAGGRGHEAYRQGREYFLLDTDEDFHRADQQLQRAQGADEANPPPIAALVEVNVTWARWLREDARAFDQGGQADPARAAELRKEAQARLDDARRYGNEARALAPTDPDVNRAMADFLSLDGAPAAQVEEYLKRSEARRPDDPELRFVRGALLLREHKPDEARTFLEQANRLNQQQTQHDLLRADYLLATIAAAAGRRDEARAAAQRILETNRNHRRAQALIAALDAAAPEPPAIVVVPATAAPDGGPVVVAIAPAPPAAEAKVAVAPTAPTVAPTPAAQAPGALPIPPGLPGAANSATGVPPRAEPRGYDPLVSAAERLLEHGHARDAVKLYEKALVEQPDGITALNGLAYAYLDTEHYNAAIDKFRQVLRILPNNGEAIIGLAETYKLRGDKKHALEFYEKYLAELPIGSKAAMAKQNVDELKAAERLEARPVAGEVHDAPPLPSLPTAQP